MILQKLMLPMVSAMVSEPPGPEVIVCITSGTGILRFPNNYQMLMEEEEWNELLGKNRECTSFYRFSSDEREDRNW